MSKLDAIPQDLTGFPLWQIENREALAICMTAVTAL